MALLRRAHRVVIGRRHDGQGAAVAVPIAVVRMMELVVLRPDELRHARDHAEDKAKAAVEPAAAEQAAMAAFVHQHEGAQQEQAGQQRDGRGQRIRQLEAAPRRIGQRGDRQQRHGRLGQPFQVVGPHMAFDELALDGLQRVRSERPPAGSGVARFCAHCGSHAVARLSACTGCACADVRLSRSRLRPIVRLRGAGSPACAVRRVACTPRCARTLSPCVPASRPPVTCRRPTPRRRPAPAGSAGTGSRCSARAGAAAARRRASGRCRRRARHRRMPQ